MALSWSHALGFCFFGLNLAFLVIMSSILESTAQSTGPCPPHRLRCTKVPTLVFRRPTDASQHVALVIASLIREHNSAGMPTVIALSAGSTPSAVYRQLVQWHQDDRLDFSRVVVFALAEWSPMPAESLQSQQRFLRESLLNHVNVRPENIHFPPSDGNPAEVERQCEDYEREIEQAGGIDLLVAGVGRNGHLGFNEPGSERGSRTRLVALNPRTRHAAASDFFGEENVPVEGVTVGLGTILSARKVVVMALGEHKASVVRKAVEDGVSENVPASFLQTHRNAVVVTDEAAAGRLTAITTPWLISDVDWTDAEEKRAVIWLAEEVRKPLLKLESGDFMHHRLHGLLRERGPVSQIRERVFQSLLDGICTKPAGDSPQKIIVFSPHPDDDVISMGGTLITLAEQGHEVHIAYMTSGNIAVFDHDALRHIDYVEQFQRMFGVGTDDGFELYTRLRHEIETKRPSDPDTPEALQIKGLIRQTEAIAGAEAAGVPRSRLHFLDLPFYRTGAVTKNPIGDDDISIVAELLRDVHPDQIYMAGDLADPHGTHRVCAEAILHALPVVAETVQPEVWLYRGAWQEFPPYEIERAVPLSPEVMLRKKMAIFKHESQKDRALYPGLDEREFWVRAEQRTKNTAKVYNDLGLPEFYALEGFVRLVGSQL
nr:6-phosphogluconolactonase [Thalassoroseus pseudoceratinae]